MATVAQNKMLVFIHNLNALPTLSGTHTLVWNDAFLDSVDVMVKWANQMIETYVKLLSFTRKDNKCKSSRVPHLPAIACENLTP